MPRQLPWANKDGGSRTQVNRPAKARPVAKSPSDIDDDFFDGTILATSSKGKGRPLRDEDESDDDLPGLPTERSTSCTTLRKRDGSRRNRAPSSSPPLLGDDAPPEVEEMRKGVSKFDLRDDEWMMVEDEFLETAKMFTRHLHIAEYEKLKEQIEAKKKLQVLAPRPVVAGSKLSIEGTMKKKAEVQQKRQIKAMQDVFASQDDNGDEIRVTTTFSSRPTSTLKRPLIPAEHGSDTEDLDTSRPTFKRPIASNTNSTSTVRSSTSPGLQSAPTTGQKPASSAPIFAKPALPSSTKPRATTSRKSRATPFDMLDDYVSRSKRSSASSDIEEPKAQIPTSRKIAPTFMSSKISRSALPGSSPPTVTSVIGSENRVLGLSKEITERIARRKAEREKEGRKKNIGVDDIPTFLV